MDKKIRLLVYLFGPTFLLLAAFIIFTSVNKLANFVHVSGKVIGQHEVISGSQVNYYPQIGFTTTNGQTLSFEYSSFLPISYMTGSNVEVLYNPQNPNDADLNTLFELWFWPLVSLIAGSFGVAAAIKVRSAQNNTPKDLLTQK